MIIQRNQLQHQNTLLARADSLKSKVDNMAAKVAKLDGHCQLDKDGAVDSITIQDSVPEASSFKRFFSPQSPVTAEVRLDSDSKEPISAKIEKSSGLMTRARYGLESAEDGSKTYTFTEVYPIGEELQQSYTFGPNGTISVNTDR